MNLAEVTERVRTQVADKSGLDAKVNFNFGADGHLYIDGTTTPYAVTNDDKEADCTITISLANFEKLITGKMGATTAFMMGRLKVAGSMGVATKLSSLLG